MALPHLHKTRRVYGTYEITSAPCSNCSFESVGRGFNKRFNTVLFSCKTKHRSREKYLTLCDPCFDQFKFNAPARVGRSRRLWRLQGATREND